MGWIARLGIVIPALVGLGWVSTVAIRMGSSDSTVYRASQEMGTWAASGAQPGEQTWNWVHEDLAEAAVRAPDNPTVHDLIGVLDVRRGERPEYIQEGLVHFLKAAELRPTSPYTWANVAIAKYRLGDTGKEFEAALVTSEMLGPSEREVQMTIADLGLAVWDEMSPSTRGAVERMVQAGMRRNPSEMLRISERRGRLEIPCRGIDGAPRTPDRTWSKLCKSTEATP